MHYWHSLKFKSDNVDWKIKCRVNMNYAFKGTTVLLYSLGQVVWSCMVTYDGRKIRNVEIHCFMNQIMTLEIYIPLMGFMASKHIVMVSA